MENIHYLISVLSLIFLVVFWKKFRLYYYSLQFPGPFTIPFVMTSLTLILSLHKDYYKTLVKLCHSYPSIFKLWIVTDLYIVNSQLEDVEIILNRFCEKAQFYRLWGSVLGSSLIVAPVSAWKDRRKEMNRSFNSQTIASFYDIFVKYSKQMVTTLEKSCGEEQTDLMPQFFKFTLDNAIETQLGVDPNLLEGRHAFIAMALRAEQIIVQRFQKFWLYFDWIFNMSSFKQEIDDCFKKSQILGEKVLNIKQENVDGSGLQLYIDRVLTLFDKGLFDTKADMIFEQFTPVLAGSETTSITIPSIILILGLHPEVQDKIYEELSALSQPDQDISFEAINRMDYLERVIKESLRLHPVAPAVLRYIDKDVKLGPYFYPAGCNVMVPIYHLHRRPDLWPNPSKFDPDRFLPEAVAKRHRCAYLPFSIGPRNCIGHRYAMLALKVALAHIVKRFKIRAVNYKSFDDLELEFLVLTKKIGYRVVFEKREV